MTTAAHREATRRESLSGLFDRLARVHAAGGTVNALVRAHDSSVTALTDALRALERDLELAARDAAAARERLAH
jgi:hypothetical protein